MMRMPLLYAGGSPILQGQPGFRWHPTLWARPCQAFTPAPSGQAAEPDQGEPRPNGGNTC